MTLHRQGNNRLARFDNRPYRSSMKSFLALLLCLITVCPLVQAQGLPGTSSLNRSPRGGTSAGGPLLPGKTDAERWSFLQAHERSFLGKSKHEIVTIIGKQGGPGLERNQLVYQLTEGKPRRAGKVAHVELAITFDDNQKCCKYAIVAVNWL